ncbi:hypothetical protein CATMQ487_38190 [Sphaerotilus microaerophilus]|uniref:Uncharacterized protein n=1 Tax=Sphaerotilus microaerophilus TaxID=2914710 RepID=A0ABN6PNP5_9BURK|nr:hypothetical protein CATMQ487_38190 [Sphaerotilus sp. FB-5]
MGVSINSPSKMKLVSRKRTPRIDRAVEGRFADAAIKQMAGIRKPTVTPLGEHHQGIAVSSTAW